MLEDNCIIDLYWARSESAISETEEKYGSYCHSISFNILQSQEDAQECVNDTYWKAWDSMPPQRPSCLKAFLGKITRNLSLDRYRLNHVQKRGGGQTDLVLEELRECLAAPDSGDRVVEKMALAEALNKFLLGLPDWKRNLFLRRYWYLIPVSQLAREIGMRESNVSLTLFRLRKKLKQSLEEEGIDL